MYDYLSVRCITIFVPIIKIYEILYLRKPATSKAAFLKCDILKYVNKEQAYFNITLKIDEGFVMFYVPEIALDRLEYYENTILMQSTLLSCKSSTCSDVENEGVYLCRSSNVLS